MIRLGIHKRKDNSLGDAIGLSLAALAALDLLLAARMGRRRTDR